MTDLQHKQSATGAESTAPRASRVAASVIVACLEAQAQAPRRSPLGRLFGASPLSEESRKFYAGALSELRIAEELAKLGPSWIVLHSVPVGERGQVIDYLVIGPGGVFAVSMLHDEDAFVVVDGDQLRVNGSERPYILASRDAATDAAVALTRATGLNVPVRGLLAFAAPHAIAVRFEPDDVGVTSDRGLHRRLAGTEFTLDEDRVEAIADAAVEPSTWRGAASRVRDRVFDVDSFDELRAEVQRAWLARGFWIVAGVAAFAIGALQLIAA